MSKIFHVTLLGGFRRRDVVSYLERLDVRQKEDLRRREREIEEARKQADQAYAELSIAREAAANLRAALTAQRTENIRLSQRAGQLEAKQAAMETIQAPPAPIEISEKPPVTEEPGMAKLSQICDRLDAALLRLDELMKESREPNQGDETAILSGEALSQIAEERPCEVPHRTSLSELLDRVRPR